MAISLSLIQNCLNIDVISKFSIIQKNGDVRNPTIIALHDSNYIIAWEGDTHDCPVITSPCSNVYFNKYDSTGNSLTPSSAIDNASNARHPKGHHDGNGGFFIVWEVTDDETFIEIKIKHYDFSMKEINNVIVNRLLVGPVYPSIEKLDENITVIWSYEQRVWTQIMDTSLNRIGKSFVVTDNSIYGHLVNSGILVGLTPNNISGFDINLFNISQGIKKMIVLDNQFINPISVRWTHISENKILITWSDNTSNAFGRIYKPDETDSTTFQFGVMNTPSSYPTPLALNSGGFIIFWKESKRLVFQQYDNNGNKFADEFVIETDGNFNAHAPMIATELANGNIVLSHGVEVYTVEIKSSQLRKLATCYNSCLTCTSQGDSYSHKCVTCNTAQAYYPLADKPTNCYIVTEKIQYYYFDQLKQSFNRCYTSCFSCDKEGTRLRTNCLKCLTGYYPLEDDPSQCFPNTLPIDGYTFNNNLQVLSKCYKTCKTCERVGNENDNRCSICLPGYFPRIDRSTMCIESSTIIPNYYFDIESSQFNKCYYLCKECTGQGDAIKPNCTKCVDEVSSCSGCVNKVYRDTCFDDCPVLTIYDKDTKTCNDCMPYEVVLNNECVSSCPDGFIIDSTTCVSCKSKGMYYYQNQCFSRCPGNMVINPSSYSCQPDCELGIFRNNTCKSCHSQSKVYFNYTCVDDCPANTVTVKGQCQSYLELSGK
jgi:hypothetical protein